MTSSVVNPRSFLPRQVRESVLKIHHFFHVCLPIRWIRLVSICKHITPYSWSALLIGVNGAIIGGSVPVSWHVLWPPLWIYQPSGQVFFICVLWGKGSCLQFRPKRHIFPGTDSGTALTSRAGCRGDCLWWRTRSPPSSPEHWPAKTPVCLSFATLLVVVATSHSIFLVRGCFLFIF